MIYFFKGEMTIKDDSGAVQYLYLDQAPMIPVPLLFWKVVELNSVKIAFVGFNFPCKNSVDFHQLATDFLTANCVDTCGTVNWLASPLIQVTNRQDYSKGYLACCEYTHFVRQSNIYYADQF